MNQVSSAFSRRSKKLLKKTAKNNTFRSKIKIPTLYCLRQVDSCLHCKFRNGAWRPRAAFQDSEFPNEDRIIDIDRYLSCQVREVTLFFNHVGAYFKMNVAP